MFYSVSLYYLFFHYMCYKACYFIVYYNIILCYVRFYFAILCFIWYYFLWSKEVWKSNFRQYGEMKKQSAGRRVRGEKVRRKKMQVREKVGKSRFTVFFRGSVAPEGRKVGSLKRRVRRQLARWEMKNCTPLWREAHFQVKMHKTPQERTAFGSWDVEKVHAVVAQSTFQSENVQSTPCSDHFWKLSCRKSQRRWKSKCTKHLRSGPLLEVEMSKKCTPLWRKAHFKVKMYKAHQLRTTFWSGDVEKVHAVVARSTFWTQNVQSTPCLDHFWKLSLRKSARRCGAKHVSKSKCTKHTMLGPLLEVELSKKSTPLEVKMHKAPQERTAFGSWDVEKVHALVARSTFQSENVQSTPASDHFLELRCRKSARRCGAKHILNSKCTKHTVLGPLLEVEFAKKAETLNHLSIHQRVRSAIFAPQQLTSPIGF